MKAVLFSHEGKEKQEVKLPECFSEKVRADIVQKYFEAEKEIQPYAPYALAGKEHSASGKPRHIRKKWKSAYGKGMSRIPRKTMWRRGTQFNWVGATVASAVGGRRAHPPKIEHFLKNKKINKKEVLIAISSALSATMIDSYIKSRYSTLKHIKNSGIVIEDRLLKLKTKQFFQVLKEILKDNFEYAIQNKKERAGKGKARGRRYKRNAGLLLVIGNDEKFKISGIEVKKSNELKIESLYPLGRLTIYTEKAIKDIEKLWEKTK